MTNDYNHIAITEITITAKEVLPIVTNDHTAASWQTHWCAIQQEILEFHAEFTVVCIVKVEPNEMVVQVRTAAYAKTRDMYFDIILDEHEEIVEHCLRQGGAGGRTESKVLHKQSPIVD